MLLQLRVKDLLIGKKFPVAHYGIVFLLIVNGKEYNSDSQLIVLSIYATSLVKCMGIGTAKYQESSPETEGAV